MQEKAKSQSENIQFCYGIKENHFQKTPYADTFVSDVCCTLFIFQ